MHLIKRTTCRVCGSNKLTSVINLGDQYLQGSFIKPNKEMPSTRKIPTSLVRCDPTKDENACGLLQMEYTVPPEVLYSTYWYRSGTNNTMRNHLKGITEEIVGMFGQADAVRVLDIGCNDGTLLGYYPENYIKYGIDPCDIAKEIKPPIHVIQGFFPSLELVSHAQGKLFDAITSIAVFYDLENPLNFVHEIKKVLSPTGIWVFEVAYMPTMLKNTSYDTICHEHIEYYSLAVAECILNHEGMRLINVCKNSINGGSLRCYVTRADNFIHDQDEFQQNISAMRRAEFDLELDTDKPYLKFQNRIDVHKEELGTLIRQLKKDGKRIHIYGASTKGNTILQWCGIDHMVVDYAAERNPNKYGAMTLGTNIPIISEAESRAMKPDYYLVLPWHFKEEFIQREQKALESGIGFIFPLPKIEIIHGMGKDTRRFE
uniref:Putative methyltransferase n=1 Tax=viral metagenome TaxID=1070528 RepID=A0A6M3M2A3_9ZZZZ